jgi:hypothetical protein
MGEGEDQIAFCVGGVSVLVIPCGEGDLSMPSGLRQFHTQEPDCDIRIEIEWVRELAPEAGFRLFDSGSVWRLYQDHAGFRFDFNTSVVANGPYKRLRVDDGFSQATLRVNERCFGPASPPAPLDYPLDELLIMHRLTQERAIELHGVGIIGPDGASNLFVGHSGAGKSTTARLWTEHHKVEILSDDRIILREHNFRGSRQIFMYGTPWHGEGCFASPNRAPLGRILILEHGHGNVLTRLSPSQAVGELFARSFVPFYRHEYIDSALAFLQHVAGSIPCYRYSFEPDQRSVERILNLRD